MSQRKQLVFLVEGEGDVVAVPALAKRLLTAENAWEYMSLDESPIKIGGLQSFTGRKAGEWQRYLKLASKRQGCHGVLAVFDGDIKKFESRDFCPVVAARTLVERAIDVGAGSTFSLGVVIVQQEFESWIIAGVESLAGKRTSDGRVPVPLDLVPPSGDLELSPRGAKEWLRQKLAGGYVEVRDQPLLAQLLDPTGARLNSMRSFRRFKDALVGLVDAFRHETHHATPIHR